MFSQDKHRVEVLMNMRRNKQAKNIWGEFMLCVMAKNSFRTSIQTVLVIVTVIFMFSPCSFGQDIVGIYLTHKDTPGGQTVVEIFEHNNKYYIYSLKNLDSDAFNDTCNIHPELRTRKSIGTVFAYDYVLNKKGELINGLIYNFHNCQTYYGKIVPKGDGKISFVGALDSYYLLKRSYEWNLLPLEESNKYSSYRKPLDELVQSIAETKKSKK